MATQWLRRTWLLAAASALMLGGCGGGDIVSSFTPKRVVAFGDAFADVGQVDDRRYTVNDGSINNWTAFVANGFGLGLEAVSNGGTSFATGNARVTIKPDAAGNSATPTVTEQIDTFLAAGAPTKDDLLIVNAGTSDVIAEAQAVIAGTQTADEMVAHLRQAGSEMAAQVRRLVDAGATHVVVVGPYNLGRSPWATESGQGDLLQEASSRFNDQLLVSMVDLGDNALYVDAALDFNLLTSDPANNGFNDSVTLACTSRDPGAGIGTGADQVNSHECTPQTIASGKDYTKLLFADRVYPTPRAHQVFGDFAFTRIRDRW
jgi:phospholipase/lecithinase/hemolysin